MEFVKGTPKLLPDAEYAIVESTNEGITVSLKRVSLDRRALIRAAEASDTPMREWLISQYRSW